MQHALAEKPRFAAKLGDALLTLAAIGGVVCIVLVLLAAFFNITLIMFKTGSMSPTIPAGSLAVVREIPAADIAVGDVVTVDRPGTLPVTHRVTSIVDAEGAARTITMRGDANPVEDPAPYTVTSVRSVLWSVPGLAQVVVSVSNPLALGGITLAASVLVTWAFWPREAPRTRGPKHALPAVAAVAFVVCAGGVLVAPAQSAQAAETETVIAGEVVRLMTVADSIELAHLVPGERVPWQVGVWAREGATGTIELSLSASGALAQDPAGLQVEVRSCDARWIGGDCASGEVLVAGPGPASAILDDALAAGAMDATAERWIHVEAWLPASTTALPTTTATLRLAAVGSGDTVATDTGGLSRTGTDVALPLTLAATAIAAGLLLSLAARVRRGREVQS